MKNRLPFSAIPVLTGLLFACSNAAFAVTYAVGPQRTYTKLQDVSSKLAPGDTMLVDGNATYTGGIQFTKAGTAAQPIVIKGLRTDGKRPVISGGTNTVHFYNCHHLIFEGFEVTGGTSRGIFHQADSVLARDIVVHDCPKQGILGADIGSGSLTLEFCEVYKCGSGSSQHQIYMTTDQVNFPGRVFRMQFCYLHDANGGNNVKSRSERNEIYYNWIEGAYYHELELIGPDPGGVDDGWTIGLKREDSDVVGNVLRKRKTAASNDTNFSVTRLGGDATGWTRGRYRFVNNTVIAGSGAVFRLFDTLESVEMHNNIFYRAGGGINMIRAADGEMGWATGAPVFAGSNNWVVSSSTNIPAEWSATKSGASPGFVNFASNDLRPGAESPCRDAGNPAPVGPDGYLFPNPLQKPLFVPPSGGLLSAPEAMGRADDAVIDIGAYCYSASVVQASPLVAFNASVMSFRAIPKNNGLIEVSLTNTGKTPVTVSIFDAAGRRHASHRFTPAASAHPTILHKEFNAIRTGGLFLVRIQAGDYTQVVRCIGR